MMDFDPIYSFNHPSAAKLIEERKNGTPIPNDSPVVYTAEISSREKRLYQYLWTMYRYYIDNGLTELDFKKWVEQLSGLIDESAKLLREVNPFKENEIIIEPRASKVTDLTSGLINNLVNEIYLPYGECRYQNVVEALSNKVRETKEQVYGVEFHSLIQNNMANYPVIRAFEKGEIPVLTHVIFGEEGSAALKHNEAIMTKLGDRLGNNNTFSVTVDPHTNASSFRRGNRISKIKTYKRIY